MTITTFAADTLSAAVYSALRAGEPMTYAQIGKETDLPRTSVVLGVNELDDLGWIEHVDPESVRHGAGRPGARFRFRGERGLVAGVDVGLHKVLVIVHNLRGEAVAEHRVDLAPTLDGNARIEAVLAAIHEAVDRCTVPHVLLAVGVGAPGMVDERGRVLLSPAIRAWEGIELGQVLRDDLRCLVHVENDAHAATLGEFAFGAGRGYRDVVCIQLGYRNTAGIVLDGQIRRGRTGAAGMVNAGRKLGLRSSEAKLTGSSAIDDTSAPTGLEVFARAQRGSADAQAAVTAYLDDIYIGMSALALSIDPDLVIIGGGISQVGELLINELRSRFVPDSELISPRIELSQLGDRAAALGGVNMAIAQVETELFDLRLINSLPPRAPRRPSIREKASGAVPGAVEVVT